MDFGIILEIVYITFRVVWFYLYVVWYYLESFRSYRSVLNLNIPNKSHDIPNAV